MKILTVIGARPQFIKAAALSRRVYDYKGISEKIIHTGQHYDSNMSSIFFDELDIPKPDYNLNIGGGSHGEMTGRQLEAIEKILLKEGPDLVLVYGDTNSTLAGALAAAKLHIKVAHIEAGLRSYNRVMPEEINRVLTDHVSDILFAPSKLAEKNLIREGTQKESIYMVGDIMKDTSLFYENFAKEPKFINEIKISEDGFVLATIHRAENTDSKINLSNIISGLASSGLTVILPLHPRTQKKITEYNIKLPENIHISDPVGYLEMIWLEKNCLLIATDSGGVQKEAYFHGKKCVTMRSETEWVELVNDGWNVLTDTNVERISEAIKDRSKLPESTDIYGNGDTANKILNIISNII